MIAYSIEYKINGQVYNTNVDAKSVKYAKNKIARKHKCDVKNISFTKISVVGYF